MHLPCSGGDTCLVSRVSAISMPSGDQAGADKLCRDIARGTSPRANFAGLAKLSGTHWIAAAGTRVATREAAAAGTAQSLAIHACLDLFCIGLPGSLEAGWPGAIRVRCQLPVPELPARQDGTYEVTQATGELSSIQLCSNAQISPRLRPASKDAPPDESSEPHTLLAVSAQHETVWLFQVPSVAARHDFTPVGGGVFESSMPMWPSLAMRIPGLSAACLAPGGKHSLNANEKTLDCMWIGLQTGEVGYMPIYETLRGGLQRGQASMLPLGGVLPDHFQPLLSPPLPPQPAAELEAEPPVYECHYLHDPCHQDKGSDEAVAIERWSKEDLEELKACIKGRSAASDAAIDSLSQSQDGAEPAGLVAALNAEGVQAERARRTDTEHLDAGFRDWLRANSTAGAA